MGAGVFDNTEHMCPICEQRVAMRVYTLVNPINSFTPSAPTIEISGNAVLHFAVDHITTTAQHPGRTLDSERHRLHQKGVI